jgi:hypothetical protein
MPYADQTQLIADYIADAKSAAEIAAVGRVLDNVSAFVDTYCKRPAGYFSPAGVTATEKRFRGEGCHFLRLPVHVFGSVTAVKLYGTVIDPANYYESEKNGWLYAEDNGAGFIEGFSWHDRWENGEVYKVTARWGYEATPKDLQEAVRQTVKAIWQQQKGVLGQVSPDGFVIERAMPLLAREILDRYKRREFEI